MIEFVSGLITMGFLVAAGFFARFWRRTADRLFLAFAIAFVLLASVPAVAHHSGAMFDDKKRITVTGVVKEFQYTNPHSWLLVDVTDKNGTLEQWSLETLPPAMLRRGGLRSDMLGKGQTVTVLAYRARNESKLAFLRKITFADGREIVVWVGDIKTAK